jgi:hypothetical protein
MMKKLAFAAVAVAFSTAALAQSGAPGGAAGGAATGAVGGAIVGGPAGAAAGAVGGAVAGAIIGDAATPRFKEYVVQQRVRSYAYEEPVEVGVVLPSKGVTYREVPREYGARAGYRYTVVNDRTVIVEPKTRKVVQIID